MSNEKRQHYRGSHESDKREIGQQGIDAWQKVVWGITTIAIAYAIYRVVSLWWVCDDAFISFRYAKNLIDGYGLVFNVGERVEGYTNFLWTMVIALGMLLRMDPVPLSQTLGALSYFGTIAIVGFLSWRLFGQSSIRAAFIPIAALCLLVCHDYHVFATSGLETSWTAMLITLGFALLVLGKSPRSIAGAGFALVAAAMSRPDALMFTFLAIPFLLVIGTQDSRLKTQDSRLKTQDSRLKTQDNTDFLGPLASDLCALLDYSIQLLRLPISKYVLCQVGRPAVLFSRNCVPLAVRQIILCASTATADRDRGIALETGSRVDTLRYRANESSASAFLAFYHTILALRRTVRRRLHVCPLLDTGFADCLSPFGDFNPGYSTQAEVPFAHATALACRSACQMEPVFDYEHTSRDLLRAELLPALLDGES